MLASRFRRKFTSPDLSFERGGAANYSVLNASIRARRMRLAGKEAPAGLFKHVK